MLIQPEAANEYDLPRSADTTHQAATNRAVGQSLRNLRMRRGLTLEQAARALGVERLWLQDVEAGSRRPEPDRLLAAADLLGVKVSEFFDLARRPS